MVEMIGKLEWQVGVPRVITDDVRFGLDHLSQNDTAFLGRTCS